VSVTINQANKYNILGYLTVLGSCRGSSGGWVILVDSLAAVIRVVKRLDVAEKSLLDASNILIYKTQRKSRKMFKIF
jgi:hypothetical protein